MPVKVVKGKGVWNIVEAATGKIKGKSKSKKNASASARIRNAAISRKGK